MKRLLLLSLVLGLSTASAWAATEFGALPDPYIGNWSGMLKVGDRSEPLYATVVAAKDHHEVTFRVSPDPRTEAIVVFQGTVREDKLVLGRSLSRDRSEVIEVQAKGVLIKTLLWQGEVADRQMRGTFAGHERGQFSLRRTPFEPSPSSGKVAPPGATVLFDGTGLEAWKPRQNPGEPIQWIITESGALEVVSHREGKRNKQDLVTKETLGDYSLHLEFKLAHKPAAVGQGRSNSGIFHLGLYETQILDSFGLYGHDNECGGIYKTREPDRNAAYPAGLWQTYDIEVQAPRFSPGGRKTSHALLTVRLNGVLIHDAVEVKKPTAGGKEAPTGPIILQDHGSPVQFRNIWVQRR